MTYPATNLQLQFDNNTGEWSYTEVAYNYPNPTPPTWQGYTTPDPEFEFAPDTPDTPDTDDDPCPDGYIYDAALKQCVPDPDYNPARYAGEPTGGGDDQPQATRVEFDASTPEGRKAMYEHGLEHGYFTTDTSKGGAYEFQGAKKAPYLGPFTVAAQFGENREYERYQNELQKEDARRKAAGQPPILAQAIGFYGLAPSFKNWGSYAIDTVTPKNIHTSDPSTIGTEQITSVTGKTLDQIQNEIAEEKLKKAKADAVKAEAQANIVIDSSDSDVKPGTGAHGPNEGYTYDSGVKPGTGAHGPPGYNYPVNPKPPKPKPTGTTGSGNAQPNPHTDTGYSGGSNRVVKKGKAPSRKQQRVKTQPYSIHN